MIRAIVVSVVTSSSASAVSSASVCSTPPTRTRLAVLAALASVCILLTVVLSISVCYAVGGLTEARTEFLAGNPNGDWTFGYLNDDGLFIPFNTPFEVDGKIVGWTFEGYPGIFGDVTLNATTQPVERCGVRWEAGQMVLNPGRAGQGLVLRWTAPAAGPVQANIRLTGQNVRGSKVTARVAKNEAAIFEGAVDGFIGYASDIESRKGLEPEMDCTPKSSVVKGDIIDFVVVAEPQAGKRVGVELTIDLFAATGEVFSTSSPLRLMAKQQTWSQIVAATAGGAK